MRTERYLKIAAGFAAVCMVGAAGFLMGRLTRETQVNIYIRSTPALTTSSAASVSRDWVPIEESAVLSSTAPVQTTTTVSTTTTATTAAASSTAATTTTTAATTTISGKLDLNTATQAQLETLPGIGEKLAARIIAHRAAIGGFRDVSELDDVEGIGEKKLAELRDLVTVK